MSLSNPQVVDAVGMEIDGGTVVLSIIDSWDWIDQQAHLRALQEKLNAYFHFIESEQVYKAYPLATARELRIDIISRYPIPDAGLRLIENANLVAAELNLTITQKSSPSVQRE